jgi:hypothetical protein
MHCHLGARPHHRRDYDVVPRFATTCTKRHRPAAPSRRSVPFPEHSVSCHHQSLAFSSLPSCSHLKTSLRAVPCHQRRGVLLCHCLPHRRPSVRPSSRYPLCCREVVNLAHRPLELDVAARPRQPALATSSESQLARPCPASHQSITASPS